MLSLERWINDKMRQQKEEEKSKNENENSTN